MNGHPQKAVYDFEFANEGGVQIVGFALKKDLNSRGIAVTRNPDFNEIEVGSSGLRKGVDITAKAGNGELRLLALHLKAKCPGRPLDTNNNHCKTLKKQLPVLEGWIDARASEDVPFAVLGDLNRRFRPSEEFWTEIDDSTPPNADLYSITEGWDSSCWPNESREYIDHIIFDKLSTAWLIEESIEQLPFDPIHEPHADELSDHCPISVGVEIPRQ